MSLKDGLEEALSGFKPSLTTFPADAKTTPFLLLLLVLILTLSFSLTKPKPRGVSETNPLFLLSFDGPQNLDDRTDREDECQNGGVVVVGLEPVR